MTRLNRREWGRGTPLLLLHGLFGSGDNWNRIARALSERFHVIAPDARNHGRSFHSPEHSYPLMADDIAVLCREMDLAPPVILGHSMGGKTALEFLYRYPALCRAVIIEDIGPLPSPPLFAEALEAMRGLDLTRVARRSDAERLIAPAVPDRRIRLFLLKNLGSDGKGGFSWRINIAGLAAVWPEIWKGAGPYRRGAEENPVPLDVPVLVITGAQSRAVDAENQEALRRWIPGFRMETVPNAGHWVHSDAAEIFLKHVKTFLSGF